MTTLQSALSTAMDRVVAMQKLAVTEAQGSDKSAGSQHSDFPYWENVIRSWVVEKRNHSFTYSFTIGMRLICGRLTEGYDLELLNTINWEWIPEVLTYFAQYPYLVYQAGQDKPSHLTNTVHIPRGNGVGASTERQLWIVEFPLEITFDLRVDPLKK